MNQKRGRLFVDGPFQGRLLIRVIGYWAIYNLALWHLLFLFSVFSKVISPGPSQAPFSLVEQYRVFAIDHVSIPICLLVTLPIFCRDLLRFSHRLVGPLIRFREVMTQMVDGKVVEEVKLRRADLPSDFLTVFNKLVKTWNERLADSATPKAEEELELVESA
jgi:hypothetical protein